MPLIALSTPVLTLLPALSACSMLSSIALSRRYAFLLTPTAMPSGNDLPSPSLNSLDGELVFAFLRPAFSARATIFLTALLTASAPALTPASMPSQKLRPKPLQSQALFADFAALNAAITAFSSAFASLFPPLLASFSMLLYLSRASCNSCSVADIASCTSCVLKSFCKSFRYAKLSSLSLIVVLRSSFFIPSISDIFLEWSSATIVIAE